jgi:small subunit ribosomal protein S3
MGQKVNPVGFRTGIMCGWKSRWYASKQEFADLLVEDQKIRNYVRQVSPPAFRRSRSSGPATK